MPSQGLCAPENQSECSEEDRRYLREKLAAAALNYPDYFKKLSKKDFFPAFETYETENRAVFERLEACAPENDAERAEMLRSVCGDLMDDIAAGMEADPRWAKKHSRSEVLIEKRSSALPSPSARRCTVSGWSAIPKSSGRRAIMRR